ncbi:DNA primase [Tissierella creatinini]|nr:DNA primase [Tissierella creatinini]TJX67156.1 DNA primase [Soehngenia saccharolytica]
MAGGMGDRMTKRIDDEIIQRINEDTSIVDIISNYVQLRRSGVNYVGLCPFHNEKTPSFTVSESKKIFHCFGCGESGSVITFIMKKENLDFREAVVFLGEKLGIKIEEGLIEDHIIIDERLKTYEINKKAARYFYDNLKGNVSAQKYLANRKLSGKVINQFGLGFAMDSWDHLYNYLSKDYSDEDLLRAGLIGKNKNSNGYFDKLRNRIVFPIIDIKSRVIGFGGRVLDDRHPKYLNSPDTNVFNKGNHLYGINLLNKYSDRKRILLVEGYMDVISLFSMGINYSVASLGTALTERQAKLIKRYGDEVFICYDSDEAGIKATLRAIDIMTKENMNPRIITLPKGMDPDDFIKEFGLAQFEKLFINSKNAMEFKVQTIKVNYNLDNLEDKISFTKEVAYLIRSLKSPIEQDGYMEQISNDTGISKEAIEQEVKGIKISSFNKDYRNKAIKSHMDPIHSKLPSGGIKAEIDIIKLMIKDKDYFEYISKHLHVDKITSPECKYIYSLLNLLYKDVEIIDKEVLLYQILEIPNLDRNLIDNIFLNNLEYQPTNINQVIDDLVNTVINSNLKNQERDLLIKIEELDKKDRNVEEDEVLKKLLWDLIVLKKELNPNN